MDVREGEFVRFPCNVEVEGPLQFQIVPQSHIDGMPSGLYGHIPSFVIPDVQGDTTVVMIVRVVETSARRQTERQLRISVSDSPGREGTAPMDFVIDCGPERYEVYEGGDDIPINCTVVDELETVDRLRLFIAPKMVGNGLRAIGDLGVEKLAQSLVFGQYSWERVGVDQLFTGYKHRIPT